MYNFNQIWFCTWLKVLSDKELISKFKTVSTVVNNTLWIYIIRFIIIWHIYSLLFDQIFRLVSVTFKPNPICKNMLSSSLGYYHCFCWCSLLSAWPQLSSLSTHLFVLHHSLTGTPDYLVDVYILFLLQQSNSITSHREYGMANNGGNRGNLNTKKVFGRCTLRKWSVPGLVVYFSEKLV